MRQRVVSSPGRRLGTFDAVKINEPNPLSYTHDINASVDFSAGDRMTEAWLELDFTDDIGFWGEGGDYGENKFGRRFDNREYAMYNFFII